MALVVAVPGLRTFFALDPPPPIVGLAAVGIVAISERLLRADLTLRAMRSPPAEAVTVAPSSPPAGAVATVAPPR